MGSSGQYYCAEPASWLKTVLYDRIDDKRYRTFRDKCEAFFAMGSPQHVVPHA